MSDSLDRFTQPARAIHIVSRAPRPAFADHEVAAGRARVAAGESPEAVASDMAAALLAAPRPALRAMASRNDRPAHRAADASYRRMRLTVGAAFMRGRKAYRSGGEGAAVAAIRASLKEALPGALLEALRAGGEGALKDLGLRAAADATSFRAAVDATSFRALRPQKKGEPHDVVGPYGLAFNAADPNAVAWAEEHAGELIDGISETSRERIKDAVARAVGGEGIDAAWDDILDAVGDDDRADVIARTETMAAANEGNRQGWDQAVEAGLLPEDAEVEWIATSGCCDECDALDGEKRPIDGQYPDPGEDGPPLHPNCRCTEGISA